MSVRAWYKALTTADLHTDGHKESKIRVRTVLTALALVAASYAIPSLMLSWVPMTAVDIASVFTVGGFTLIAWSMGFRFFLMFWVFLATLQNFFVGFFAFGISMNIPVVVTEQKTVALVVALSLASPQMLVWLRQHRTLALLIFGYLALVLFNVRSIDTAAVAYGRNFVLPVLALVLVLTATDRLSWEKRRDVLTNIFRTLSIALATGVLLELTVGTQRWRSLLHAEFNGGLNSLSTNTNLFGVPIPRVGGLVVEPTNLGYIAATLVLTAFLANQGHLRRMPRWDWVCTALALAVLCLSGAKSGFLMLAVGIVVAVLAFRFDTPKSALVASGSSRSS